MKFCFSITHTSQFPNAKLLVHSIKASETDYDIYIYIKSNLPLLLFDQDVHIEYFALDHPYVYFPFLDKIYAAAHCESKMVTSFLWIDVDSYFHKATSNLYKETIRINPVDKKNIGILKEAPTPDLWVDLLKIVHMDEAIYRLHTVETTISKETIYPYFNLGMVYLSPSYAIFHDTKQLLIDALSNQVFLEKLRNKPTYQIFLHQAIFSLVLLKKISFEKIHPLPKGLNFPLHLLEELEKKPNLKKLRSFRYDTFFENHDWPTELQQKVFLNPKELKLTWYYQFLEQE
jgi:hypothetical protein